MRVVSSRVVPARGVGRPDYSKEVSRGISVGGYRFVEGEFPLWFALECCAAPGPSVVTRGPLLPGETAFALDVSTGLPYVDIPAGWDVLAKEFWLNFSERTYFEFFHGGTLNDLACLATLPADACPPVHTFQQGWTRSILEDITVASRWTVSVNNLGLANSVGKVWVLCMMKEGAYTWL